MVPCSACGKTPRTPLLCESCGALLAPLAPPTPFEALGVEPVFALDLAALQQRLVSLSRALHPDFFAAASAETRRRAEDNTAALNAAFQVLADDSRRADWLVQALGGPRENEERSMPGRFLQEVLEWNEAIDEAQGAPAESAARAVLDTLEPRLRQEREVAMQAVAERLTPLPERGAAALREVRQRLNAVRYLDRALREIGELRLAAARP